MGPVFTMKNSFTHSRRKPGNPTYRLSVNAKGPDTILATSLRIRWAGSLVNDKVTSFAFLAIRGKFVRVASADRREILLVQPGSMRLIKPKAGTWQARTQALWAISMGTLVSTSLVIGILQSSQASLPLQAVSVGVVLAIFIPIGSLQQGMILNRLARREGSTSEELRLKSFKLGRFGHSLVAGAVGGDFALTVYGSRRRFARALRILGRLQGEQGSASQGLK